MRHILQAALAASLLVPAIAVAQDSPEPWQALRESNAELFRREAYVPPPGQWYKRTNPGQYLDPAFYTRQYWIENHAELGLPAPDSNHRYIRYGNDVLLMRKGGGRVARVYRDFFL